MNSAVVPLLLGSLFSILAAAVWHAVRIARSAVEDAALARTRADEFASKFADYQTVQGERVAKLEQKAVENIPSEIDLRIAPIEQRIGTIEERWERWLPQIILTDKPKPTGD